MSLQVWLPLNGDLSNQGLNGDVSFSNTNTDLIVINNNGKIGKCYNFSATTGSGICSDDNGFMSKCINNKSSSMCCWINTSNVDTCLINLSYGYGLMIDNAGRPYLRLYNRARNIKAIATKNICDGNWHHIATTYNKDTGLMRVYIDGELSNTNTYAAGYIYSSDWTNGLYIGRDSNNSTAISHYFYQGKMNDVRIYDHCLSAKEVKEISKGLVVHYKMSNHMNSPNLIKNGFGNLGNYNWNTTANTSQVPDNKNGIIGGFSGDAESKEYIPIDVNHQYTMSLYIKATTTSSVNTYPSIFPYDIDKQFIKYEHIPQGFRAVSQTTLTQPLSNGDTIMYLADVSKWNNSTTSHQYIAAIFGYTDSTGYTYPDMTYTRNIVTFGTYSDKSNINYTNNTVTLTTPYSGATVPAGTTVCQTGYGATYYYPWGGINTTTIQDWTFKTRTFYPKDIYRLQYAKYFRIMVSSNSYCAGISLTDDSCGNQANTEEFDCSGFGYDGTISGTLTTSIDSPRYDGSYYINGSTTISHSRAINNEMQEWTCCAWVKPESLANYNVFLNNFNLGNRLNHGGYPLLYLNSSTNDYYNYGNKALVLNEWNHIAFVFNNSKGLKDIYINGENCTDIGGPNKTSTPQGIPNTVTIGSGFVGYLCDYREYACELSASDIKELATVGASIDNDGNFYSYEVIE